MTEVRYSIKDLENFTGIKAHTIRIWEQRYGLFTPKRTDTNIRFYNEEDLKKILNINLLYTDGLKISKIAQLPYPVIMEKAKQIIENRNVEEAPEVNELIISILEFDKVKIKEILNDYTDGIFSQFSKIIIPFLSKIGELWQVNTIEVVHEHLFSNLYREFIITQIQNLETTDNAGKKALLFLHEEEQHEFSILLYYYLFKTKGYNCYYLGQNLPLSNLGFVIGKLNPDYIISTTIAQISEEQFISFIEHLKPHSKDSKVIIGGYQTSIYKKFIPSNLKVINSEKDFSNLSKSL
ncbi:MAG: MerR family transcriptional regulator [Crocinitomicaceae bacterium]|nr:MerR family transcriptional regulator [Crocinitomicaceae bacterium]